MKNIIIITFCFISSFVYSQNNLRNYYPNIKGDTIIINKYYTICYDIELKSPLWSIHLLTKEQLNDDTVSRDNYHFKTDKNIETADDNDYKKSGFDRGHIVPAEDLSYSEMSMEQSFKYYNCSPQEVKLNRGIWKTLENDARLYTSEYDSLLVISGVYFDNLENIFIGDSVFIPSHFYKIYYDFRKNNEYAISFILKNIDEKQEITNCIVSIDSLELITGIDFFPKLNDKIENKIEENKEVSHFIKLKKNNIKQ